MKTRLLVLPLLLLATVAWAEPSARYAIKAQVDVERGRIAGTETLTVTNRTSVPLSSLDLFLYPNRFLDKDPGLNEMNYRWYYPSGFDDGGIQVTAIQATPSGATLSGEFVTEPSLPARTVYRVALPAPLRPGAELTLTLTFDTKLPYKYGPMGRYRDTLTAQGGWYPYLAPVSDAGQPLLHAAPDDSEFAVTLSIDRTSDAVVNGVFFDDVTEMDLPAGPARYVTLVVAPQLYPTTRAVGTRTVTFYSLDRERYKIGPIMDTLADIVEVASQSLPVELPDHVAVVETYLRAVMTYRGERMLLVSDRFFVTVTQFDMRNLNKLEAARALAGVFLADAVARRESRLDYNWVVEAEAWAFRNEYLRTRFEELSNLRETAGRMGMFRPFNRMAESPTIPFSETYVGFVVNRDPLRESLLYFNNDLPSGQLFSEKLEGTLGGETARRIFEQYLQQESSFESFVAREAGQDMTWFFTQWKRGYPSDLDYRLAEVAANTKTADDYRTTFRVEKATSSTLIDPVEVRVSNAGRPASTLIWDGNGTSNTFEVTTPGRVSAIEIDPRRQTAQLDDYNDLWPHGWEMVMDRGDVDIGSGGLGAGSRIRMHKQRDRGKWMFVLPFFSPAEAGVEAGMLFNFGGTVEGLVWNRKQELSLSYSFTDLRSDFASEENGRVDGRGQNGALKFRYTFQNKMFEEDPMDFESVELTGALSREELGGDFNFFQVSAVAAKALALHPRHKLAGLAYLGYADGFRQQDEIPAQRLFDLSAIQHGAVESGNHLGETTTGLSLEWRHDLMSDLNMAMPMNMRVRRLQGVLALDSGWVAREFDDLWRLNQGIYGIRYGIRFHYDFLGIRPSNFTFDIGHRLGRPTGRPHQDEGFIYAIGILQSF